MAKSPRVHVGALLVRARRALRMSQTALGDLLGGARATIGRWEGTASSSLSSDALRALIDAVHKADPALAEEIAAAHGQTLARLRIGRHGGVPLELLVDTVVCAAADRIEAPPSTVRPALRAALDRAKALGLDLDELLTALSSRREGVAPRGGASLAADAPRGKPK